MIIHIALFKWKSGISDDKVSLLLRQIKSLKSKCPGIMDIFVGENYHQESKGLTHGVVVLAENQKALDGYRKNSFHKKVASEASIIEADGIGFDFKDITQ